MLVPRRLLAMTMVGKIGPFGDRGHSGLLSLILFPLLSSTLARRCVTNVNMLRCLLLCFAECHWLRLQADVCLVEFHWLRLLSIAAAAVIVASTLFQLANGQTIHIAQSARVLFVLEILISPCSVSCYCVVTAIYVRLSIICR